MTKLPIPFTEDFANSVYDVLVNVCGAAETMRSSFVHEYTSNHPSTEWRFQGKMGFGGKFYLRYDRMTVNCYQEDLNDAREWMRSKANEDLAALVEDLVDA